MEFTAITELITGAGALVTAFTVVTLIVSGFAVNGFLKQAARTAKQVAK